MKRHLCFATCIATQTLSLAEPSDVPRTTENSIVLKAIDANGDGITSIEEYNSFLATAKGDGLHEMALNTLNERGVSVPMTMQQAVRAEYEEWLKTRQLMPSTTSPRHHDALGIHVFSRKPQVTEPVKDYIARYDAIEASPNAILSWIAEAPVSRGDLFAKPLADSIATESTAGQKEADGSFSDMLDNVAYVSNAFAAGVLRQHGKVVAQVSNIAGPTAAYLSAIQSLGEGIVDYGGQKGFVMGGFHGAYDIGASLIATAIAFPVVSGGMALGAGTLNPITGGAISAASIVGGVKLYNHVKSGLDDTYNEIVGPALAELIGAEKRGRVNEGQEKQSAGENSKRPKVKPVSLRDLSKRLEELAELEIVADNAGRTYKTAKKQWDSDPSHWSTGGGLRGIRAPRSGEGYWDLYHQMNQCSHDRAIKAMNLLRLVSAAIVPKPKLIGRTAQPFTNASWFGELVRETEEGEANFKKYYGEWEPGYQSGMGPTYSEIEFHLHESIVTGELKFYAE